MSTVNLSDESRPMQNDFTGYIRFKQKIQETNGVQELTFGSNSEDIYKCGYYDQTLLVRREPEKSDESMLAQFFEQHMLTPKLEN